MKRILLFLFVVSCLTTSASAQSPTYLLSTSDLQILHGSFQFALENSPTSQSTAWANAETGLNGSMIPLKTFRASSGQYCREYLASLQIGNLNQQAVGTACRQPQGNWKVVSERLIGHYANIGRSGQVEVQNACVGKDYPAPPNGDSRVRGPAAGHYHQYHSQQGNHIHGDRYRQHVDKQGYRGMPQAKPKTKPVKAPSKLIKLVDYQPR